MKRKSFLVHSNDLHDNILMTIIEVFNNVQVNNRPLILLIPSKKKNRIIHFLDELPENFRKRIIIKTIPSLIQHKGNSFVRILNGIIYLINLIKSIKEILKSEKVFFLDYGYNKLDNLLLKIALCNFENRYTFINFHDLKFFEKLKSKSNKFDKISGFTVLSKVVMENLEKKTSKKIMVIPDLIPNQKFIESRELLINSSNFINFKLTVIGSVDTNRRDYFTIINSIAAIENDIELVFLGKASDLEVIKIAQSKVNKFRYFKDFISHEDFQKEMLNTSYIITWINNKDYNSTKISGNIYDAIKFGVPIISNMPNFSLPYNQNIVLNSSQELTNYLKESIEHGQWRKDSKLAINKAKTMNVTEIARDFQQFVEEKFDD